ncbi:MAG: MBG domain-containing protein [Firmicutes bacterium]|nr:MBG domain-containing protein [Bacillota bacterium]
MKLRKTLSVFLCVLLFAAAGCGSAAPKRESIPLTLRFAGESEGALTYEYSGTAQSVSVEIEDEGYDADTISYSLSYFQNNLKLAAQPLEAGAYLVSAEITSLGFEGSHSIPFVISKKNLSLSADNINVNFGTAFPTECSAAEADGQGKQIDVEFSAALASGIAPAVTFGNVKPALPGYYVIRYTVNDANYGGSCTARLTINPAPNAYNDGVVFAGRSAVYDGAPKPVTIVDSGMYEVVGNAVYEGIGDTEYQSSETAPSEVGKYKVTFGLTINAMTTQLETSLTISKRPTIQFAAQNALYTDEPPAPLFAFFDLDAEGDAAIITELTESMDTLGAYPSQPGQGAWITFEINHPYYSGFAKAYYFMLDEETDVRLTNLNQVYGYLPGDGYGFMAVGAQGECDIYSAEYFVGGAWTDEMPALPGEYEIRIKLADAAGEPQDGYWSNPANEKLVVGKQVVTLLTEDDTVPCGTQFAPAVKYADEETVPSDKYSVAWDTADGKAPAAMGVYAFTVTLVDEFYQGTVTGSLTLTARTGLLSYAENYSREFTGNPVNMLAELDLQDYHNDVEILYQEIVGGEPMPAETTPPTNSGVYQVTFNCMTDGVPETLSTTLTITALHVNTSLAEYAYQKGATYAEGIPYTLPSYTLPAGETLDISFDGFTPGGTPSLPGDYAYTVTSSRNLSVSQSTGTLWIILDKASTAVEYGKYHFDHVAPHYKSTTSNGTATSKVTIIITVDNTQYMRTMRLKDGAGNFLFEVCNRQKGSSSVANPNTTFAIRMFSPYNSETIGYRDSTIGGSGLSVSEPTGVNTTNRTYSNGLVISNWGNHANANWATKTNLDWFIGEVGFNPKLLSAYTMTADTIDNYNTAAITRTPDGGYTVSYTFNKRAVVAEGGSVPSGNSGTFAKSGYVKQVDKYSDKTYNAFISLSIAYTFDKFGRIIMLDVTDNYQVSTMSAKPYLTIQDNIDYSWGADVNLTRDYATIYS